MQPWLLPALLILHCCIPLALGNNQLLDVNSLGSVENLIFKGSKLRVFEIDGVLVAEPRIDFADSCGSIRYNHMYLKYQLSIPLQIDVNTLNSSSDSTKMVGRVTLTELNVVADKALSNSDSKVTTVAHLKRSGGGLLIFLCDTFIRCQSLRDEVTSDPEELWRAVKLVPVGRVGASAVSFGAISGANSPRLSCNPDRWVVFQRRVDGSLSFAQNWDAYVKGFGNPKSNYWMGLDRLFAMTMSSEESNSRCRMRVEATDLQGKTYWGEYKQFRVLGPKQNYQLILGQEVTGSQVYDFVSTHNNMPFSTYDNDNDKRSGVSCSRYQGGYGGWWFNKCHRMNLNGAYTTDKNMTNSWEYTSILHADKWNALTRTLMKFKCN